MHIPVLLKEVIAGLNPQKNENFIDATIGQGGHTFAILEKNKPIGKVLGIEIDLALYQELKAIMKRNSRLGKILQKRLILINDSYLNLVQIVKEQNFQPIHGILFDLGMCSWHLEQSGRGFSFLRDEPLDMRFDIKNELTAAEIINFWSKEQIEKILKEYGEERYARKISKAIVWERKNKKIFRTTELVALLKRVLPKDYERRRIHFATRVFQALRIAVNNELENIKNVLGEAINLVVPQGRIAVISFHSLEDRIVKNVFQELIATNKAYLLTKKPIIPSINEIENNPRARSAKLRLIIKN